MGRHKKSRIEVINDEGLISKKAMKDSSVVAWGHEPDFLPLNPLLTAKEKKIETEIALANAINWYNALCGEKNIKTFFIDYATKNFPSEASKLKHLDPDIFICGTGHTYGIVARLIMRGWPIQEQHVERLEELIHEYAKVVSKKEDKPVTIKARDSKITEAIGIVNGELDDFGFGSKKSFPDTCLANVVLKVGCSNAQRLRVQEHFVPMVLELKEVIDGKNVEIKEAYTTYTKSTIKKVYDWLTGMPTVDVLQVTKKIRKARKKKVKTAAQLLKNFKCQVYDDELKINSVNPESIIGAQQLWVFNTKTRKLGVYYASDEKGLSISRMSIDNYDEATSFSKKIRKPKEVVPQVISAGKVALRHILEDIRATKSPMKGRVGDVVLLLRVVK